MGIYKQEILVNGVDFSYFEYASMQTSKHTRKYIVLNISYSISAAIIMYKYSKVACLD